MGWEMGQAVVCRMGAMLCVWRMKKSGEAQVYSM
jgi:hypothetical protein